MMFIIAPDITPAMAKTARPCERSKLLKTKPVHANGVPRKIILEYSRAYGRIVGVEPKCFKISSLPKKPNNPRQMLIKIVNNTAEVATIEALKLCFLPKKREILLPAPIPIQNPTA